MESVAQRRRVRLSVDAGLFARATIAVLIAATAIGCTSRKQYAINEALLISERRQLEDEIYRVQFELRDALEENERLREQIGDCETSKRSPKEKKRARPAQRAPFESEEYDETLFPGGDTLDVSPTKPTVENPNAAQNRPVSLPAGSYRTAPAYEGGNEEVLPDFVPIPNSSKKAKAPTSAARTPKSPNRSYGSMKEIRRTASKDSPVHAANLASADRSAPQTVAKRKIAPVQYVDRARSDVESASYEEAEDEYFEEEEEETLDDADDGVGEWSPVAPN